MTTSVPEDRIFQFERDFAGSLRCIPMAMRMKLDQCGVKLSLRQWSRFSLDDRTQLVDQPCGPADQAAYRARLIELIEARTGEQAQSMPIDPNPEWADRGCVPEQVREFATAQALAVPSIEQWAALSPLQRFALVKLSRAKHDNVNFVPAMREFGLT